MSVVAGQPTSDGQVQAHPPFFLAYSLLLGIVFAGGWFFYTAAVAEDGRTEITTWLDPFLAGATLSLHLVAIAVVMHLWARLPQSPSLRVASGAVVASQWIYVVGEVLSNTITIGEPPRDIGSLLEIGAGVVLTASVLALACGPVRAATMSKTPRVARWLTMVAVVAATGLGWWFTHPIPQSTSGAPACVEGNPLYNAFHGPCG